MASNPFADFGINGARRHDLRREVGIVGAVGYDKGTNGENRNLSDQFGASARPIVTVDIEKYQSYLDDSNLTPEKKEEFLQAVWSIVVTYVELGFGVHPLQEVCGQDSEILSSSATDGFDKVKSEPSDKPENL